MESLALLVIIIFLFIIAVHVACITFLLLKYKILAAIFGMFCIISSLLFWWTLGFPVVAICSLCLGVYSLYNLGIRLTQHPSSSSS
jgi:hypothetical protein